MCFCSFLRQRRQEETNAFCGMDLEVCGLDDSEYVPAQTSKSGPAPVEVLPGLEGDDIYPGLSATVNQWLGREEEEAAEEESAEREAAEEEPVEEEQPAEEAPEEEEQEEQEEPSKEEQKPKELKKHPSTLDTKNSTSRYVPAQKPKKKLFKLFGKKK